MVGDKNANTSMLPPIEQHPDDDEEDVSTSHHGSDRASEKKSTTEGTVNSSNTTTIAKGETKAVRSLKVAVFVVLTIFAIGVACAVYFYITNEETKSFEDQFHDDATQVLASLGASLDSSLAAIDSLVVQVVSMAQISNQTWPFVTIPNLEVRTGKIRKLANSVVMIMYPFVTTGQRPEWERYSAENGPHWVDESLNIQQHTSHFTGPIIRDYETWNVIHRNDEYEKPNAGEFGTAADGPYLPQWQHSPVVPTWQPYNWDYMGGLYSRPLVEAVQETHQVGLTAAFLIAEPDDHDLIAENQITADWYSDFIAPGEEPMEPMSDILYPIIEDATELFDLFQDEQQDGTPSYKPADHNLVGLLSVSFYWRDMIKNILPAGSHAVVVFENPCSPTFTYAINGPTVKFLGTGDFHQAKYDHLEESSGVYKTLFFFFCETGNNCDRDCSPSEPNLRLAHAFLLFDRAPGPAQVCH